MSEIGAFEAKTHLPQLLKRVQATARPAERAPPSPEDAVVVRE